MASSLPHAAVKHAVLEALGVAFLLGVLMVATCANSCPQHLLALVTLNGQQAAHQREKGWHRNDHRMQRGTRGDVRHDEHNDEQNNEQNR
jgi:hypothetical protein